LTKRRAPYRHAFEQDARAGQSQEALYTGQGPDWDETKIIRTDKLAEYTLAIWNAFGIGKTRHVQSSGFGSEGNINLLERFHGTVKQRTKVMRHFKVPWCAATILEGFITHYNFLHEHEGLGGITPATAAGIGDGVQSWDDLIRLGQGLPIIQPSLTMPNPPRGMNGYGNLFLDIEGWGGTLSETEEG